MSLSQKQQLEVLDEAFSWIGTPWRHAARIKGAGVDCANFLVGVYSATGLIEEFDLGYYPIDWNLHRDEPRFINKLLSYANQVQSPEPGDIAMFKFGRHAAHGSIVIDANKIIHAYRPDEKVTISELQNSPLASRLYGYYRIRGNNSGR